MEAAMAKAAKSARKRKTAVDSDGGPARDPVDALLALVADEGWRAATLGRVASASGLSLADLYDRYGSKTDLLIAYARRVDTAMLSALGPAEPAAASTPDAVKDRLFEAVMARLDALAAHKPAIRVLMRELPADPAALAVFLHHGLSRGLDWTLAAADLDAGGFPGMVRRKLLGGIYLDTLRVWLKDDSPDLAVTMAHLDKRLGQAIRWLTGRGPISQMRDRLNK
jgi:AcrR family transcriptional regulator